MSQFIETPAEMTSDEDFLRVRDEILAEQQEFVDSFFQAEGLSDRSKFLIDNAQAEIRSDLNAETLEALAKVESRKNRERQAIVDQRSRAHDSSMRNALKKANTLFDVRLNGINQGLIQALDPGVMEAMGAAPEDIARRFTEEYLAVAGDIAGLSVFDEETRDTFFLGVQQRVSEEQLKILTQGFNAVTDIRKNKFSQNISSNLERAQTFDDIKSVVGQATQVAEAGEFPSSFYAPVIKDAVNARAIQILEDLSRSDPAVYAAKHNAGVFKGISREVNAKSDKIADEVFNFTLKTRYGNDVEELSKFTTPQDAVVSMQALGLRFSELEQNKETYKGKVKINAEQAQAEIVRGLNDLGAEVEKFRQFTQLLSGEKQLQEINLTNAELDEQAKFLPRSQTVQEAVSRAGRLGFVTERDIPLIRSQFSSLENTTQLAQISEQVPGFQSLMVNKSGESILGSKRVQGLAGMAANLDIAGQEAVFQEMQTGVKPERGVVSAELWTNQLAIERTRGSAATQKRLGANPDHGVIKRSLVDAGVVKDDEDIDPVLLQKINAYGQNAMILFGDDEEAFNMAVKAGWQTLQRDGFIHRSSFGANEWDYTDFPVYSEQSKDVRIQVEDKAHKITGEQIDNARKVYMEKNGRQTLMIFVQDEDGNTVRVIDKQKLKEVNARRKANNQSMIDTPIEAFNAREDVWLEPTIPERHLTTEVRNNRIRDIESQIENSKRARDRALLLQKQNFGKVSAKELAVPADGRFSPFMERQNQLDQEIILLNKRIAENEKRLDLLNRAEEISARGDVSLESIKGSKSGLSKAEQERLINLLSGSRQRGNVFRQTSANRRQ